MRVHGVFMRELDIQYFYNNDGEEHKTLMSKHIAFK